MEIMESNPGTQENEEEKKPLSREMRIFNYYLKIRTTPWTVSWQKRSSALTLKLKRRARQKELTKMTPEELAQDKEQSQRARIQRLAWTQAGYEGWAKYYDTTYMKINGQPPKERELPQPPIKKIKENEEEKIPLSREMLIRNHILKTSLAPWPLRWQKRSSALTLKLKRKARQKVLTKTTPVELARDKEQPRKPKKQRPQWTQAGYEGWVKYYNTIHVKMKRRSPTKRRLPSPPTKKVTGMGQMEGKGTWNADYCPSLEKADTVLPKYVLTVETEKREIYKEKVLKGAKQKTKTDKNQETKTMSKPINEPDLQKTLKNRTLSEDEDLQREIGTEENNVDVDEKLYNTIDGLQLKSTSSRATSLSNLRFELCRRMANETISKYQATITEALERSLKKGGDAEKLAAAKLLPILCIQWGDDYREQFVQTLKPFLLSIITNESTKIEVKSECCRSLAVISFLSGGDMADILELMSVYETIYSESYPQDNNNNELNKEAAVHAAALDAWTLLLSLFSPANVYALLGRASSTFSPTLSQLTDLLQAPSIQVRMSAGVALTLAYELGSKFSETFGQDEADTIITEARVLIRESHKYRSKDDLKNQRAIFRNVLMFFEERETPVERVFIANTSLELDQWLLHVRYNRLAATLGSGLQMAAQTDMLRTALHMERVQHNDIQHKDQKQEKCRQRKATSKSRTKLLSKSRDKRSITISF